MMKRFVQLNLAFVCAMGLGTLSGSAETQTPLTPPPDKVFALSAPPTPAGAPAEISTSRTFKNVSQPILYVYLNGQAGASHPAILIIPGGGYAGNAYGECVDEWLAFWKSRGFVVFGLKYRLTGGGFDGRMKQAVEDLGDALAAIHQHAAEWGVNPDEILTWGASAGSNATLNYLTQTAKTDDATKFMPRFSIILSPWPGRQKIDAFTFSSKFPPMFIASAKDDKTASESFAAALVENAKAAGCKVFFHLTETGGHQAFSNFGAKRAPDWTPDFFQFLKATTGMDVSAGLPNAAPKTPGGA
jgi:acetyl esterase/lipase